MLLLLYIYINTLNIVEVVEPVNVVDNLFGYEKLQLICLWINRGQIGNNFRFLHSHAFSFAFTYLAALEVLLSVRSSFFDFINCVKNGCVIFSPNSCRFLQ